MEGSSEEEREIRELVSRVRRLRRRTGSKGSRVEGEGEGMERVRERRR